MNARTLLGIAAAGTLAWSHGAVAGPHDNVVMNNGALVVITPFSPNESGPAERPEQRLANLTAPSASTSALAPVITPLADNEVGPNELRPAMRNALAAPDSSLMPNPQTPWSVSESGADSYGDYLAAREQQVVAFEHARIAAAEWNAQVAAIAARNAEIAAAEAWTADGQPALGATAGSGVGLTLEGGSAVGVLEGPRPAGESAVWNVEPLTPNADLTTGQTVVILPGTADTVVVIPGEPASGAAGAAGPL